MQLLDQQYFNTPFYGCILWLQETDVLAQGFRLQSESQASKTIDANHQLANHL